MKPFSQRGLAVAIGYLAVFTTVDAASLAFQISPGVATWYPPSGISFALVLGLGTGFAPALFIASLLSSFFIYRIPQPPWALVGWAIGWALVYTLGALFLRRLHRGELRLFALKELSAFVLTALVLPIPLALASVSAPMPGRPSLGPDYAAHLFGWWMGEVTGLITVTPFLLAHVVPGLRAWAESPDGARPAGRGPGGRIVVESLVVMAVLIGICALSFSLGPENGLSLFYLAFLPLAWMAVRHGVPGATAGILAASVSTALALQLFRYDPGRLPQIQFILLMLGVTGLYIGSVVSQRRRTEDTYRTLVDHSLQGLFLIQHGRIVFANQAAADIVGDTVQALTAYDREAVARLVHADDRPALVDRLGRQAHGDPARVSVELRIVRGDGALRWVRLSATPASHHGQDALQAAVIDITATKEAEVLSRRHAEQLKIINEIGHALTETLDLQEILHRLSQATHRLLPDIATLFVSLYDSGRKHLTAVYGVQDGEPIDTGTLPPVPLQPPGEGTQSQVIHTGQPLVIDDLPARLKGLPMVVKVGRGGPDTQSALYVPMNARGEVIGVLQVQSCTPARFGPADAELLSLVGNTAAIAIQNAGLFAENLQRLEAITAFYSNAQKLSLGMSSQRLAEDVARTCVEGYGVQMAWLGRAEPDGTLRILACFPPDHEYIRSLNVRWDETPEGRGPGGRAFRKGYPTVIDNIAGDESFVLWRDRALAAGFRSVAALPLISRDTPIGVLQAYSNQQDYFNPHRISFLQAYSHQVAAALENTRLFEETEQRIQQLQALHAIDLAINASADLSLTLKVALNHVVEQQKVDAATVLIADINTQWLEHAASVGFYSGAINRTHLRFGQGYAGRAALERQPITILDLNAAAPAGVNPRPLAGEKFVFYHAVPLITRGQIKGVLEVFHRAPLDPTRDWLDFMETIASQTATAIDNTQLFNGLQRTNTELALAYDATIEGWSRALDLRDRETEGHTQRVTDMTVRLAQSLGMSEDDLIHVRRGALLHDIGKMGVPDHILLKPGPLTEDEWEIMKMHPVYAYEMLSPITYLQRALDIPYCHHEKWDGTGYPRGLRGDHIPLAARIFAVVDVWDALRSDRPYRRAWPESKVRDHIRRGSGTHFEPAMVQAFMDMTPAG